MQFTNLLQLEALAREVMDPTYSTISRAARTTS